MAESARVVYRIGKLYHLPTADLQPDPDQPRKYIDKHTLNDLKASIEKHGVLEPVLVRKGADGRLLLVSGERRYQASILAGCQTIPAIVIHGDPMEISIVENLQRENLTAIEEAEAIERLKTQHNYRLSDLSAALGKPDLTLSEILSLNRLPIEVKNDCRNGPKAARGILAEIARKKNPAAMTALYSKYKESGLTRREIRKKPSVAKTISAPVTLTYISACAGKIDLLDLAALDQAPLIVGRSDEIVQLRIPKAEIVKNLPHQCPRSASIANDTVVTFPADQAKISRFRIPKAILIKGLAEIPACRNRGAPNFCSSVM